MSMAPPSPLTGALGPIVALTACALPSADNRTTATAHTRAVTPPGASEAQRKSSSPHRGPMVIDAELLGDGKHLRLYLSEPVASTEGVDPNDFRLSMALTYGYKRYSYAYYYDLQSLGEADELLNMRSLAAHEDTLELEFDQFIDPADCAEFQQEVRELQEPGVRTDGGLFLHYAPGERAITDSDNNQMAAIAADWVLHKRGGDGGDEAYEMTLEGPAARRALRDPIRVRCPPELPPGPR